VRAPLGMRTPHPRHMACAPPRAYALLPKRTRPLLGRMRPVSRHACPYSSASLIVPPPVRAPLFIRSGLSFIHMRPYFICLRLSFISVCPYFICAHPTLRPYVPLWQPFVPSIELCALQLVQYNGSLHPTIQRGSDVAATVDKVTPILPCQRSTWR
jgi:hypothetical protein